MKEELNLLKPEQQGAKASAKKMLLPLYIVATLLVLEVGAWAWFWYKTNNVNDEIAAATTRISELDAEISKSEPDLNEAIGYQSRVKGLSTMLSVHVFWSQVFAELSKFTYKNIQYDGFQGDLLSNHMTVTGIANSYLDIAKLILGLKQSDKFTDILFTSGGAAGGAVTGYGFTLDIGVNPSLLTKP